MLMSRCASEKEDKKRALFILSYKENIFMYKVATISRYDLNIKVMLAFEKRIMLDFRVDKSWWFGKRFHMTISSIFGLSLHKIKQKRFREGFWIEACR